VPNCVQTGHPGHGMIKMSRMERDQLLFFSFPVEAGFCPYIAGPALAASAIVRALLPKPLFTRVIRVRGRGFYEVRYSRVYGGAQFGPEGMYLSIHFFA
jgi:hypothetical protein